MTSPHPPGHFRQAHFLMPPFSTSASVSSATEDMSDKDGLRSIRRSNSNRCRWRRSREIKCLMLAYHVQKRLHVSPSKCLGLDTTGTVLLWLDQMPAFVPRVKPSHTSGNHPRLSCKSCNTSQPLVNSHGCCFRRESDDCRRRIAITQHISVVF